MSCGSRRGQAMVPRTTSKLGWGTHVPANEEGTKPVGKAGPERTVYQRAMDAFARPGHLPRALPGPRGAIPSNVAQHSEKEALELASKPIRAHVESMRMARTEQVEQQLKNLDAANKDGVAAAEMAAQGKRGWLRTSAASWGVALALTLATGGMAVPMLVLTSIRLLIAIGDVRDAEKDLDAVRRIANGETGVQRPPMGANSVGNLICSNFGLKSPTDRQKACITGVLMAFRACLGIAMIAVAGFITVPATLLEKGIRAAAAAVGIGNEVHDYRTSEAQFSVKEARADALLALDAIRVSYLAQVEACIKNYPTEAGERDRPRLSLQELGKLKRALQEGATAGAWARQERTVEELSLLGEIDEDAFDTAVKQLVSTTAAEWQAAHDLGETGDLYKGMLRGFSGTSLIRNAFTIIPALIAAA